MLIFGDYDCLVPRDNMVVLNLNSFLEGYERLNLLPPFGLEYGDKDFDMKYAEYILTNDNVFMELMKVIISLYAGKDVYILSAKNNIYEFIAESLQKFIQQRYGYLSNILNDMEDWEYVEESSFNIYGVYNLDIDKERFSYIYASYNKIEE